MQLPSLPQFVGLGDSTNWPTIFVASVSSAAASSSKCRPACRSTVFAGSALVRKSQQARTSCTSVPSPVASSCVAGATSPLAVNSVVGHGPSFQLTGQSREESAASRAGRHNRGNRRRDFASTIGRVGAARSTISSRSGRRDLGSACRPIPVRSSSLSLAAACSRQAIRPRIRQSQDEGSASNCIHAPPGFPTRSRR